MNHYIAKIKDRQSIIFFADDVKDAIRWANDLKNEIYGKDSELTAIWNHEENKYVEL